jgi:hypothetical protein
VRCRRRARPQRAVAARGRQDAHRAGAHPRRQVASHRERPDVRRGDLHLRGGEPRRQHHRQGLARRHL